MSTMRSRYYLWVALAFYVLLSLGRAWSFELFAPELYLQGLQQVAVYAFPAVLSAFGDSAGSLMGATTWAFRFPSLFLAMGLLLLLSETSRALFGESRKNLVLVVLMSSLAFQFLSLLLTGDLWLLAALLGFGMMSLLYLKQPTGVHAGLQIFFLVFGLWVAWLPMLLGSLVFWMVLRFFHPFGKSFRAFYLIPFWIIGIIAGVRGMLFYTPDFFFFAWPYGGSAWRELPDFLAVFVPEGTMKPGLYLLLQFFALLPWLGFLVAGLYELVLNFRKREEMALVTGAFLLGGLFSYSLLPQWAFALLIGRQLEGYVKKNYPYENAVKGFAILQLVISFALVFVLVFFGTMQGEGRFGIWAVRGFLWWMPSVVGVLGLFMKRPWMYIGGPMLAAFLSIG